MTNLEINYLIGKYGTQNWNTVNGNSPHGTRWQLSNRTDPDQDYGYYDLTKDAEHILTGSNRRAKNCFDRVKYWPPKSLKKKLMRKHRPGSTERRASVFNASGSVSGI